MGETMRFSFYEIPNYLKDIVDTRELAHLSLQAKNEFLFRDKLSTFLAERLNEDFFPLREWNIKQFPRFSAFYKKQADFMIFKKLSIRERILLLWKDHYKNELVPFIQELNRQGYVMKDPSSPFELARCKC
jgi:hypothetical protein